MNENVPSDIIAKIQAKYDWMKQRGYYVGDPGEPGIYRTLDGGWQCNYGGWCAIVIRPGETEPHEIHGAIGQRWYREWGAFDISGKRGSLGHPISDEEIYEGDGDPNDRISHFENGDIIWTAKTDDTRIVNIRDRAHWYKAKHDQLLDLLRRAVEAPAPERHNEALKAVDDKCKDDQFDVVLLGNFQSGKSTTLDILCGGREVSPQGEGTTPTSAVPVSVQSLSPNETEEWGEIRFKSKRELTEELFDTFEEDLVDSESKHPLKQYMPAGEGSAKERFCEGFDFDNSGHFACAQKALVDSWAKYGGSNEAKRRFSTRQRQLMEVSTLIVRFYHSLDRGGDDTVRCPVDGIGPYVWFPSDWQENASLGFAYDISEQDARFAFVERVILHLRSSFLEELGCRVTDCPGLDASAYDTSVTKKALLRADGILFFRRFDQMIGRSDLGNLFEFVQDTGRTSKTVLALNVWRISRNAAIVPGEDRRGRKTQSLLGASKQRIAADGFEVPILWCSILLAYLSALGEKRIRTGIPFSQEERRWLSEKADIRDADLRFFDDGRPDDALLVAAILKTNEQFKAPELNNVNALDAENVAAVLRASNFEELISSVKQTVLREKTGSILVDNGSKKALEILQCHEAELLLREDYAKQSERQCAEEVASAQKDLDDYEREAEAEVARSRLVVSRDDAVVRLSRELVDDTLSNDFFSDLARRIAKTVRDLNKRREGISSDGFLEKLRTEVGPLSADYFADRGVGTFRFWAANPKGRWSVFCEDVWELDDKLQEIGVRHLGGKRIFDGVPIPALPDELDVDGMPEKIQESLGGLERVAEELREGFFTQLLNVLTWISDKIVKLLGLGQSEEEILSNYAEKIRPVLEQEFQTAKVRNILEEGLRPVFKSSHHQIVDSLGKSRKAYRDKILARCDELIEDHRASDEELHRIVEENRRLREECIAPLRREIELFETTVKTALP